ncbi:MAG: hypothetical protein IT514_03675 [Burkholderiales bacterium]|nr:hypothetical protein [Burkholderiales bacterium]
MWRAPLLAFGFLSLFTGVAAGLARLGWTMPGSLGGFAWLHGPLMVSGFLGTVISLERAVALSRRWAYLGPLLAAAGGAAALAGMAVPAAALLFTAGAAVFLAASLEIHARQREAFTLVLALGALCWLAGNALWLGGLPPGAAVPSWIAFLVLTIAGERLELSRVLPPARGARIEFAILVGALLCGAGLSVFAWEAGTLLLAAALVGSAAWLLRRDVARRTIRMRGLPRYMALCLLAGYLWLVAGGAAILAAGGLGHAGPVYDAALHAVFVGFVFSMIFGHAPIIFPAVLRVAVPFSVWFYAPLALLHASLAVRLAGDWLPSASLRGWGGALNAVAVLLFVVAMVTAVARGRLSSRGAVGPGAGSGTGLRAAAVFVAVFGALTILAGGSTLFGEAAAGGSYVPFVVWFNFLAGFAYLAAAIGLWRARRWAAWLAIALAAFTVAVFGAFGVHIAAGGAFETRTVWAMAARSAIWIAVAWFAARHTAGGWRPAS